MGQDECTVASRAGQEAAAAHRQCPALLREQKALNLSYTYLVDASLEANSLTTLCEKQHALA